MRSDGLGRWVCGAAVALVMAATPPAGAQRAAAPGPDWLVPPVDGAIVRRWQAPGTDWGPGHRGIDYAVPTGTAVRAAAPGTVAFAGSVAGILAVTIEHGGGLETTYSMLSAVDVARGQSVTQGQWVGKAGSAHAGGDGGLHFGVKLEDDYVDPERYLGPLDVSGAIHLDRLAWRPDPSLGPAGRLLFGDRRDAGAYAPECEAPAPLGGSPEAPSDNVAVAVAGIGSKTSGGVNAEVYEHGPELLGYPTHRTYRFSYKGASGIALHEPYQRTDTYGDLRLAAARLRDLLIEIGRRHPGANVDLIAHSQGGLVARTLLATMADAWSPGLPHVEHFVTFATPHAGAPLAEVAGDIERESVTGGLLVDAISDWSRAGGLIPDPRSQAVAQLAPGSDLIEGLAAEDVSYGTRVLALAMPHDVVVPADHAVYPGKLAQMVPVEGWNGHSAIVRSAMARGIAHAFLRDGPRPCSEAGPGWGRAAGAGISFLTGKLGVAYGELESRAAQGVTRLPVVRKAVGSLGETATRIVSSKVSQWRAGRQPR